MVTYSTYNSVDELPRKIRKHINKSLFSDEEFIYGVDCKNRRAARKTKLVLTNRRIIAVKNKLIGWKSTDYDLNEVSSVEYNKSIRKGTFKILGDGTLGTYPLPARKGQKFSGEVRTQLQSEFGRTHISENKETPDRKEESNIEKIRKLKELNEDGILSDEEFEQKKSNILEDI